MKPQVVRPASLLRGAIFLPGDKSIAHRAVILGALSAGVTTITNFPTNKDCLCTLRSFQKLGITIGTGSLAFPCTVVKVRGAGLRGLVRPRSALFIGESGTTFRLLLGVLAGQDFKVKLLAGASLSRRPMARVTACLRLMGAAISARRLPHAGNEEFPPVTIKGGGLRGIVYTMPIASAQVKSAILLAGLNAQGVTKVIEPVPTRDHTERMLEVFQARVAVRKGSISVTGRRPLLSPGTIYVPGDISSASFFLVAAALLPCARVVIKNVGINPTRTGAISVLKRMGADIKIRVSDQAHKPYEPIGDIVAKSSKVKGTRVSRKEIPSLIDELPVLMVAASMAEGKTIFEGIGELRVKETDRIRSMSENLTKMGAQVTIAASGKFESIIIHGSQQLFGAHVRSFGDHRTAMSMVIAGLAAKGLTTIDDISCISKSFPHFLDIVGQLTKQKF